MDDQRSEWFKQFVTDAMRSGAGALEAFQMAQTAMQTNDRAMLVRQQDFDICRRLNELNRQQYDRLRPKVTPESQAALLPVWQPRLPTSMGVSASTRALPSSRKSLLL